MQKVIIIGGTGLLGYHAGLEFLSKGYKVSSLNIPDLDIDGWFPKDIHVMNGNVFQMTGKELRDVMQGYDVMIYAVGPDDRTIPRAPSYEFFKTKLVETSENVFKAAREAGIKRSVLLNSYFAYFARKYPDINLVKRHNYIRARIEQAELAIEAGKASMDVMVLELPYIFGTMPGRIPIWKEVFLDRLVKFNPVFYPAGGTTMITVEHVAEAICGAIEFGDHGIRYPIGDVNMTWREMLSTMFRAAKINRKIYILPVWIAKIVGLIMQTTERLKGNEPGLNLRFIFQDIISKEFYLESEETIKKLKYGKGGLIESIEKTAKACYPKDESN